MSGRARAAWFIAAIAVFVEVGIATHQANEQGVYAIPSAGWIIGPFLITWVTVYVLLGLVDAVGRRMGLDNRTRPNAVAPREPDLEVADRSRRTAAKLALFLGAFGIHKFYLGRKTHGVIYLLACWTLIPLVCGVVECIWLSSMSNQAFAAHFPSRA